MVDLNQLIDPNLHLSLYSAVGINDSGQIIVNANHEPDPDHATGTTYAVLLTPLPEPGTWALFGVGLLLMAGFARSYAR